jgi:L-glutamine:2-deoxy-scyllo-inosose/3-amino-2,3-dideoxy-scyllo-inosose aminotransferase
MGKLAVTGGKPVRTKPWPSWPIRDDREVELVAEATRKGPWSFDGPKEWEFGEKFAAFSGTHYGLCVANGTVALQLSLEALDIGAWDEVIVPGLTWQATAAAALDINAIPILVDVEPDTYTIDPKAVEAAITDRTKVIIPVHLYGCMADMDSILAIAKKHNLKVIEDSSHQHGSQWNGKGVGSMGTLGAFSLQETKLLTSGEGGIVLTNDRDLMLRVYSLRNCGRLYKDTEGEHIQSGNYRITEFQAAVLLAGLERLESQTLLRDENAQYLNSKLAQIDGIQPMKRRPQATRQAYYYFTFRYDPEKWQGLAMAKFREALTAETGFEVEHLYQPLNNCDLYQPLTKRRYYVNDEYWKAIDPRRFSLPVCERVHNIEGVGMHHAMLMGTKEDMDDIVRGIEKIRDNLDELL